MSNEIAAALVGVIGALCEVRYGGRLSRQAAQELLARQASAEFAAAFSEALVELHMAMGEKSEGFAHRLLKEYYPRHLAAYLRLRGALPAARRAEIDVAWKRYTNDDDREHPVEREFIRFSFVFEGSTTEHRNLHAIKHINALIDAAT